MKLSITKSSIEHLVATGCTDLIVEGIKALEAEIAELKAEVDKLTPKKPAFFTWTDKTFIDKVEFDKLQAENEKLETEVASIGSEYMAATRHYNSLHNNLQAENERLKDELGLMHQMFEKHLTPEIRKAIVNAAKGVQS